MDVEDAAGRPAVPLTNGSINLRKTHPGLYRATSVTALATVLLALNFFLLTPTFPVYAVSYWVWGSVFLAVGICKLVFLNISRNLRLVRQMMSASVFLFFFFVPGTMQPWLEGEGSLQLPIMYLALGLIELPLLIEPFINTYTAKGDK